MVKAQISLSGVQEYMNPSQVWGWDRKSRPEDHRMPSGGFFYPILTRIMDYFSCSPLSTAFYIGKKTTWKSTRWLLFTLKRVHLPPVGPPKLSSPPPKISDNPDPAPTPGKRSAKPPPPPDNPGNPPDNPPNNGSLRPPPPISPPNKLFKPRPPDGPGAPCLWFINTHAHSVGLNIVFGAQSLVALPCMNFRRSLWLFRGQPWALADDPPARKKKILYLLKYPDTITFYCRANQKWQCAIFCIQLFSKTVTCTLHLSLRESIDNLCFNPIRINTQVIYRL